MMGERQVQQDALFYEFSLERHVPEKHLLRSIDRFVELDGLRRELAPFYSEMGRPSIDPELMIRMLIVGYCFGIRSERRLCEEVHLNLAYRWFCRLGLDGDGARSLDLLEEPPWPFSRQRSAAAAVRDRAAALHRRGSGRRRRLCRRRQFDPGRRQRPQPRRGCRGSAAGRGGPRRRGISRRPRRCGVRRGKRGDAQVHRTGRSGDTVDRRAPRTGLLRLFGQLSDRCRQRDHRRCRGDDGDPPGRDAWRQSA